MTGAEHAEHEARPNHGQIATPAGFRSRVPTTGLTPAGIGADERRPTHATFGLNLYRQAVLTEARARLAELVPAEARDWCQIDMRVACGEPSVEILRAAADERADLVVLGAGHPGPIDRMLFGSTTPQVLRQASSPALVVRGGGEATRHEGLDQTIPRPVGAEGRSRGRESAPQGRTS